MAKRKNVEKPKEFTRRQLSHAKKEKRRHRIILITGIVIVAAIILLPLIGWFISEFLPMHQTVLEVNGVKFNMRDYIDTMKIGRFNDSTKSSWDLVSEALQYMEQGEIIRQGAAKLGIAPSENETESYLEMMNLPDDRAYREYYGNQLLIVELQNSYFGENVVQEADQVHPLMMMLESDARAAEIRERIASGDNFTALAEEYAMNYYSKNVNSGDFGYHIREVLKSQVGTDFPLDYAFGAEVGDLSQPISDNETYKQWGYWLIKLVERPEDGKVEVQALFLSDNATAMDIRSKLEANKIGLGETADAYSQYSLSRERHGDLGIIDASDNSTYTQAFNDYVWNEASPLGVWSEPLVDKELWTVGGSWLVKVLEKENNRPVSDEDKNYLISEAFNDWYSSLSEDPDLDVNNALLTDEMKEFAVNKLEKEFPYTG